MSAKEAEALISAGVYWWAHVWGGSDKVKRDAARDKLLEELNTALEPFKIKVSRGWQDYDPVVKINNKAHTYKDLAQWAGGQKDGGKAIADTFYKWCNQSQLTLSDLDDHLKAFAVITHFAEVGRGYKSALELQLYPWMLAIGISDAKNAKALWLNYKGQFAPALTYKEDTSEDFKMDEE